MKKNNLLKAPNWCKWAIATVRGWIHPITGELLKCIKMHPKAVKAHNDAHNKHYPPLPVEPGPDIYTPLEKVTKSKFPDPVPINDPKDFRNKPLNLMTKKELQKVALGNNLTIASNMSKKDLLTFIASNNEQQTEIN